MPLSRLMRILADDDQAFSVNQAGDGVMERPIWMLVPWAVFAIAAGIKFWRFAAVVRRQLVARPATTAQARKSLERIWNRDQRSRDQRTGR
jgi:hypothetical protein